MRAYVEARKVRESEAIGELVGPLLAGAFLSFFESYYSSFFCIFFCFLLWGNPENAFARPFGRSFSCSSNRSIAGSSFALYVLSTYWCMCLALTFASFSTFLSLIRIRSLSLIRCLHSAAPFIPRAANPFLTIAATHSRYATRHSWASFAQPPSPSPLSPIVAGPWSPMPISTLTLRHLRMLRLRLRLRLRWFSGIANAHATPPTRSVARDIRSLTPMHTTHDAPLHTTLTHDMSDSTNTSPPKRDASDRRCVRGQAPGVQVRACDG